MTGEKTALITGASAGIGAELSRQLAQSGWNLVLIARREERLAAAAETLSAEHGVQVEVLACDLADADAAATICAWLKARSLDVDWLINNAGYGVAGKFLASEWRVHRDFLQVMVGTVTELTWRLAEPMTRRGAGRITNIASLAGLMPATAGHTLYGPVKAWMIRFSEALALELNGRGVQVTAVCPGFTYSEFHDVVGTREQVSRLPKFLWNGRVHRGASSHRGDPPRQTHLRQRLGQSTDRRHVSLSPAAPVYGPHESPDQRLQEKRLSAACRPPSMV